MSPVLLFDIIALIIDIVGDNKDTSLLKELSLVSHSFHQISSKHLFATVELHDADPDFDIASSKKGFIKLLTSRPDVVKYIRKLTYILGYDFHYPASQFPPTKFNTDVQLSPILPNFLQTISRLNSLTIVGSTLDWNTLDSSLTSAFLHLMHLHTINHIDLSSFENFPLSTVSSLTPSVNLLRLDISHMRLLHPLEEDGSHEIVVESELMPKIREFRSRDSSLLTTKLLHAKRQDGQPAFNFTDLRRLWMSLILIEDEQSIRCLLQNAKLIEILRLSVDGRRSLVGLLFPSACTLKVLDLTVLLYEDSVHLQLAGLCGELEAMAGHNMLEVLSLKVDGAEEATKDFIGSIIQNVEKVLVKPGWSALRLVSFKISTWGMNSELIEALQSLPDEYLSHLSKLESVAFYYSACL